MMLSNPRPHKLEIEAPINHTASIFGTVLKRRVTAEQSGWGGPGSPHGASPDGRPGHHKSWSLGAHELRLFPSHSNLGAG
jgi:hypothetical protein